VQHVNLLYRVINKAPERGFYLCYNYFMKKAFTLIELLVVIAIIGVLTSIVLTQFSTVRARARDAKRVSDISNIQLAIQQYFDRCNQYPNATASGPSSRIDINSSVGCPYNVNGTRISLQAYLNQVPNPPSEIVDNSNPYTYRYVVHNTGGVNDDYYLVARLEQRNKALDDDIDTPVPTGTVAPGAAGWSGWRNGAATTMSTTDTDPYYIYAVRSR